MKDNFLQSLNSYTDALEQKMDSLERRVAELEQALNNALRDNEATKAKLTQVETLLVSANQQLVHLQMDAPIAPTASAPVVEEPEIEPQSEITLEDEPIIDEETPVAEEPVPTTGTGAHAIIEEPQEPEPIEEMPEALSLEDLPTIEETEEQAAMPLEESEMEDIVPIQPIEDLPAMEEEPIAEMAPELIPEPIEEPVPVVEAPAQPEPQPAQPQVARPNLYGPTVGDIRQAISLGDRFLFQRELFNQSGEKLQKTLDALNQCTTFDEALGYLDDNFKWDKESTAYTLFINVLHRRFG